MGLNAKTTPKSGGNYVEKNPLDVKMYPARVVEVIDLGLQPQRDFQGESKPPCHQIRLTYELSHEFMFKEDSTELDLTKPRWIGEDIPFYNLENTKAKSTRRYNAVDPTGSLDGDFLQMLSLPCQVMVTKTPDKKNEGFFKNYVGDVSAAMEVPGYEQPELINPTKRFSLDEPDMEVFSKFPEWLQKKIKSNLEYVGSPLAKVLGESPTEAPSPTSAPPAPVAPPVVPVAPPAPVPQ